MTYIIRPIVPADDARIARIIRSVLEEFDLVHGGSAYDDPEVDAISVAYSGKGSAYFVLDDGGEVVGGGGFGPLEGGEADVCEVRKMYFAKEARGNGFGKQMLSMILSAAREQRYKTCYLETIPEMKIAHRVYESLGFRRLDAPMGATGHSTCQVWYAREL